MIYCDEDESSHIYTWRTLVAALGCHDNIRQVYRPVKQVQLDWLVYSGLGYLILVGAVNHRQFFSEFRLGNKSINF